MDIQQFDFTKEFTLVNNPLLMASRLCPTSWVRSLTFMMNWYPLRYHWEVRLNCSEYQMISSVNSLVGIVVWKLLNDLPLSFRKKLKFLRQRVKRSSSLLSKKDVVLKIPIASNPYCPILFPMECLNIDFCCPYPDGGYVICNGWYFYKVGRTLLCWCSRCWQHCTFSFTLWPIW
jgi:hypothetical protein